MLGTTRRVRILGTINGKPFTATANPWRDASYVVTVRKEMRTALGLSGDEEVDVEFEVDESPQIVVVPDDLRQALSTAGAAEAAFEALAPTHRHEYIRWVGEAKQPAARERRIKAVVEKMAPSAP